MGPRALILWSVAAVVSVAVAVTLSIEASRKVTTATGLDEPVFVDLVAAPERAAGLTVTHGDTTVSVALQDGAWTVPDRWSYAADEETIGSVIRGLVDLRYAAPRTALPERFQRLDVDEPSEGSGATRITVTASDGAVLADAIIGKRSHTLSQDDRGIYLRLPDAEQAWLATGAVDAPTDILDWLETDLPSMDRVTLKTLVVKPADGEAFTVGRLAPEEDLTLVDQLPEGRSADADAIRQLAGVLAGLRFEDLRPAADVTWPDTHTRLEGTGFDDERLVVELGEIDGDSWARIETIDDWVYRLPDFQQQRMDKRLDDLLQAVEGS